MFYTLIVFCVVGGISGKLFFDVHDLLNVDLMPGNLLLLEGNGSNMDEEVVDVNVTKSTKSDQISSGSIMDAYSTMGFHRKMMNEYLCRNFVADQILSDISLTRMKRRMGTANKHKNSQRPLKEKEKNPPDNRRNDVDIKNNLLTDEGSSNYKHWLSKSSTLEDIYRHYENRAQDRLIDEDANNDEENEDDDEEYDRDVTGYAAGIHTNHQGGIRGSPSKVGYGHSGGGGYGNSGYGGNSGYSNAGYGSHDYSPQQQHVHYYHDSDDSGKGEKELALTDFFEIALTAIAFLSFACYILQVVMCITNSAQQSTAAPMMVTVPVTGGDYGDGDDGEDDGAEPVRIHTIRYRRSTENTINERLNELARRVLLSIESALVANEDEGNCLRQHLCENNKYSRTLKDSQKIWVPAWSFGMSYLSGRFITRLPPATVMLDSLKASILGLGNANCRMIYPDCNLREMRENRRRRRRKRETEENST